MSIFKKIFNHILNEDNVAGGAESAFGSNAGNHYGDNTEGDGRNIFYDHGLYSTKSKKKKKKKSKKSKGRSNKKKVNREKIPAPSQPMMMTRNFPGLLSGPTGPKGSAAISIAEHAIKTESKRK
mgnify:CR=1 FL=1|tara:strand:+ start:51 stop:422 length:372 start_codon:yes stop_codon:yes gene_type:complete